MTRTVPMPFALWRPCRSCRVWDFALCFGWVPKTKNLVADWGFGGDGMSRKPRWRSFSFSFYFLNNKYGWNIIIFHYIFLRFISKFLFWFSCLLLLLLLLLFSVLFCEKSAFEIRARSFDGSELTQQSQPEMRFLWPKTRILDERAHEKEPKK